jgi:hypothetical protein
MLLLVHYFFYYDANFKGKTRNFAARVHIFEIEDGISRMIWGKNCYFAKTSLRWLSLAMNFKV